MDIPEQQRRIDASMAYFLADAGESPEELAAGLPRFVCDTARLRA